MGPSSSDPYHRPKNSRGANSNSSLGELHGVAVVSLYFFYIVCSSFPFLLLSQAALSSQCPAENEDFTGEPKTGKRRLTTRRFLRVKGKGR